MGKRSFLDVVRFAENRILVEQLRLLLGNVISTALPVVLLTTLMAYTLVNDSNRGVLLLWWLAVNTSKLVSALIARHYLASPIPHGRVRPITWLMIGLYTVNGLIWGTLPWLTMDTASDAGRVLVMSLMAGVIGSAMAQSLSILPVFLGFATATLAMVTLKLLSLDDPVYSAFAAATLLYLLHLVSLARNNTAAALTAIELRFTNTDLLDRLREKSKTAMTARREAELASQAKSKFLAAASHDLRQPIHAQGLFLDVLSRTALNAQQLELVNNIRSASQSTSEMLNTLLDFSRIEAGVIRPQHQTFALQPLLHKLENELAPLADTKGLIYRSRDTRLMVLSDPALVELILRNFITNAIRYTQRGGLLVGCRHHGDNVLLEVWDTGIGIEASQQGEIFREFHQLGNPERDSRKGLGLGLAIAEGLAETLGHRLSLVSTHGRGSVFRLTLPRVTASPLQASAELPPHDSGLQNTRVLVIDDEETVRIGMQQLLRDWGCVCDIAEGIEEALELARENPPQIVISDYRLRGQNNGSEAITAVRRQQGTMLPALLITGDTAPERIRDAEKSGIPLLHKPVSPEQLHRALTAMVHHSGTAPGGPPSR